MLRRAAATVLVLLALGAAVALVAVSLPGPEARDRDLPPRPAAADARAQDEPAATGWTLAGVVRAPDRGVLAGARVHAGTRSTTTGPDGRFEVAGLPPGPVEVTIALPGHALRTLSVPEGGRVDVRLAPVVPFAGAVVLGDSAPAGASVRVHLPPDLRLDVPMDREGRFEVSHLPADRYIVAFGPWVSPDGVAWLRTSARLDTQVAREVVLAGERGELIAGRVLDPSGAPLAGASVVATAYRRGGRRTLDETTSDADGAFRIAVPADVSCQVIVDTPDDASGWRFQRWFASEVTGGGDALDVRLEPGATIAGTITAPRGHGVVGRAIAAYRIAGQQRNHVCTGRIGPDGRFALRGLWDASYELRVEGVGGADDVHVLDGGHRVAAGREDLALRVVLPVRFAGRVLDRDGAAAPRMRLIVHHTTGGWTGRGESDDEGRFAIERVPPGALRVIVLRPGHGTGSWEMGEHRADDDGVVLRLDWPPRD